MSTFEVKVYKLTIEEHPNADALEIARIGDYKSCVRKDSFKTGDLAAYIPEASLVPQWVLKELGLEGRLNGKEKNRVKATRLRGVLSQGLVYPAKSWWTEGQNVQEDLQITKWEPKVPAALSGETYSCGYEYRFGYDIENIKKFPNVIQPGEEVVFTEKVHGTNCLFCIEHTEDGLGLRVTSKGLSARGFFFKLDAEKNANNLYCCLAKNLGFPDRALPLVPSVGDKVWIRGELFGGNVQDLGYGAKADPNGEIGFRVFDIFVGMPNMGRYLGHEELQAACDTLGLERTPVLYVGPFSKRVLEEHTNGRETVSGKLLHVREGVVVRPVVERYHDDLPASRVQLKSISEAYLTRKGGTEYN